MKKQEAPHLRELTSDQLKDLYFRFTHWRDTECGGTAELSVHEYHRKTWVG